MQWQEQRCLLTGASGGIGKAIARSLAEKGVELILVGRDKARLERLLSSLPGDHHLVEADLTLAQGRDALMDEIHRLGGITMLVNNAGITELALLHHSSESMLEQTLATNLLAPMQLTRRLLPQLLRLPEATIVNVGSAFGSIGFAGQTAYCASKFGLRGFTEALYRELADTQVKVFYLAPRATDTDINTDVAVAMNQQLGNQVDHPDVVAKALITQLETGKSRMYIGFPEKLFVRINGMFPGLVDNALLKKLPIIKRLINQNRQEVLI